MKILVTGANGYLGRGIVESLAKLGQEIVATDISTEGIVELDNINKVEADLFNLDDPYTFFGSPDIMLHLAWRDGFVHNSKAHLEDLSKHMLFLDKMFNSKIKKISVMGSMHEVGFYEGSVDENTETNPMTYYGIAKDALRKYVIQEGQEKSKDYQWLRAYYIVGNTSGGSSIFSKIVEAERKKQKLFPFTTGVNQYDFLDYGEFTHRIAITLVQNTVLGVINVCSGQPMRLSERVENFIQENGFDIKLEYGAFPDRKYDSKAMWGNSEKMERILSEFNNNGGIS
ncbi:NAD-dependent epimerase/dehydratase family protein [Latilactobacillus sakei]|uniref:NAD-dependent epimerase/dehydratase family protein n=1 Tax=Latilactobacillus sakei TaxID=1599 RepID=UPI0024DF5222|nr:NAD(P)-dependent oxidoreductase [Latilactobacillus sakei]